MDKIKKFNEYTEQSKESSDKLMRVMNKILKDGCIIASFQRECDISDKDKKERFSKLKKIR